MISSRICNDEKQELLSRVCGNQNRSFKTKRDLFLTLSK